MTKSISYNKSTLILLLRNVHNKRRRNIKAGNTFPTSISNPIRGVGGWVGCRDCLRAVWLWLERSGRLYIGMEGGREVARATAGKGGSYRWQNHTMVFITWI